MSFCENSICVWGNKMKKVVIISAMPSPYRVDFFWYLINSYPEYKFYILYISSEKGIRAWDINQNKMANSTVLKSKILRVKRELDDWNIIITYGVLAELNKIKPDIIIGSEYNFAIQQAVFWAKRNKVPYISWTDGSPVSEKNIGRIQKVFRKRVFKISSAFIASSSKSKELQIKYGASKSKIFISFLTVNINNFKNKKLSYNNEIIYVGSLIKRKGVDLLLEALSLVKSDFILNIVGDGKDEQELKRLTKELGIEQQVVFHGFKNQTELKHIFNNSSIFILPTREDCFGLVTLEAMCSSLPVICSKYADGAYDLVEDGRNGYIIDPNNSKIFAEKIDELLCDKDKMTNFGKESLSIIEKFSFKNVSIPFITAIKFVLDEENKEYK